MGLKRQLIFFSLIYDDFIQFFLHIIRIIYSEVQHFLPFFQVCVILGEFKYSHCILQGYMVLFFFYIDEIGVLTKFVLCAI